MARALLRLLRGAGLVSALAVGAVAPAHALELPKLPLVPGGNDTVYVNNGTGSGTVDCGPGVDAIVINPYAMRGGVPTPRTCVRAASATASTSSMPSP